MPIYIGFEVLLLKQIGRDGSACGGPKYIKTKTGDGK